jgi:hypothetical protein
VEVAPGPGQPEAGDEHQPCQCIAPAPAPPRGRPSSRHARDAGATGGGPSGRSNTGLTAAAPLASVGPAVLAGCRSGETSVLTGCRSGETSVLAGRHGGETPTPRPSPRHRPASR